MVQEILMGQLPRAWNERAKSITFCVTEDCNLACKYCYMTGKNNKNRMSFDVAKRAVDYILGDKENFGDGAVVWEFIGGEPFLEIRLIDAICDYIKQQMFLRDHPWFNAYRFNFSTNGLNYHTHAVQKFIWKNNSHVSIGISIDGNKTKHDLQRVRRDGSGSFDLVAKNAQLWMSQMPDVVTKATFSHDDLPYLKDSIIALWDMGIKYVAANVVFEDVWVDGDDSIFEQQLLELADHIIDNKMYYEYSVRFFDPQVGNPLTEDNLNSNFCGAGNMLAIDCHGNFYPCVRFYDISLTNKMGRKVGDIWTGIDQDRLRPFHALTLRHQSSDECVNCEVGRGCAWCNGCNYDYAAADTIFERATYICKMHKANARANEYFWSKFEAKTGLPSEKARLKAASASQQPSAVKFGYIMTEDDFAPHCNYRRPATYNAIMDDAVLEKSLAFCRDKELMPVFLGDRKSEASASHFVIAGSRDSCRKSIAIFDNESHGGDHGEAASILLVSPARLPDLATMIDELLRSGHRINVILEDLREWHEAQLGLYEQQLRLVAETIETLYVQGRRVELNVLTDIWHLKEMCNCEAGENSFTIAPNGKLYICPAFYFSNVEDTIGDLDAGIRIPSPRLLKAGDSAYCGSCDIYSCRRCKFLNKHLTGEMSIPSKIQCQVSYIERRISVELQQRLIGANLLSPANHMRPVPYTDSLDVVLSCSHARR